MSFSPLKTRSQTNKSLRIQTALGSTMSTSKLTQPQTIQKFFQAPDPNKNKSSTPSKATKGQEDKKLNLESGSKNDNDPKKQRRSKKSAKGNRALGGLGEPSRSQLIRKLKDFVIRKRHTHSLSGQCFSEKINIAWKCLLCY